MRSGLLPLLVLAATRLLVVLGVFACGGDGGHARRPSSAPSDAEDYCGAEDTHRLAGPLAHRPDFGDFCKTRGSNPELENRMTKLLIDGGASTLRLSVRCRANVCSVKCVTVPRQQCVDDLHAVGMWSANEPERDVSAMSFQDERGQAFFRFFSSQEREALAHRRQLVGRIARRLHSSSALESCKQNASAHGLLLLYIDVPTSGTPSVTVGGDDVAQTAVADCVSKALLAAVIDEHVPPFSARDLPIAVKL